MLGNTWLGFVCLWLQNFPFSMSVLLFFPRHIPFQNSCTVYLHLGLGLQNFLFFMSVFAFRVRVHFLLFLTPSSCSSSFSLPPHTPVYWKCKQMWVVLYNYTYTYSYIAATLKSPWRALAIHIHCHHCPLWVEGLVLFPWWSRCCGNEVADAVYKLLPHL